MFSKYFSEFCLYKQKNVFFKNDLRGPTCKGFIFSKWENNWKHEYIYKYLLLKYSWEEYAKLNGEFGNSLSKLIIWMMTWIWLLFDVDNAAAAAAKSFQLCPTLYKPIDNSPPGSTIPGILQGRTLEWVAISSSNAWKWKVKVKSLSRVQLFKIPWTEAYHAPPSMGFSRQEYWSGLPYKHTKQMQTTLTVPWSLQHAMLYL